VTPVARVLLGVVLVAGAGPAGFLIYHAVFDGHPLPLRQQNGATATLAPPALTTGTQASGLLTLPETVALPDSNGHMHHLTDYRGHPLVLNFWATWCEPCRREMRLLQALHQERGAGVQIVGVAMDFQSDALKYAQAKGITYPLLMGQRDGLAAVNAFGMDTVFPFTVFADARGDIVAVKVGELHADEAQLILGEISAVDGGSVSLAVARSKISEGLRALAIARAQQAATAAVAAGGSRDLTQNSRKDPPTPAI
jgi:thiol-disulfide isomerase/thioredoxin